MKSPLDFRTLKATDAQLYASLEGVRQGLGAIVGLGAAEEGRLSAEALDLIEKITPGSREVVTQLANGHPPQGAAKLLEVLTGELSAQVPGVNLPRWMSAVDYDAAQVERAKESGLGRITITPRDFDAVASLLKLNRAELPKLSGQPVLSIGEGASNFTQVLGKKYGAQAVATDWWYGQKSSEQIMVGERMHDSPIAKVLTLDEAKARLPDWKVASVGEALPFKDGAFEAVYLANVLGWYFSPSHQERAGTTPEQGQAIIREALRVTARGGELRFNLFSKAHAAALAEVLRSEPGLQVVPVGAVIVIRRPTPTGV